MKKRPEPAIGPIVSSAHLASGAMPALSELEFGLIMATHAFQRWIVRGMAAAGAPGLQPLDVLVLHTANHRGRAKTQADICLVLNVEDTHLVTYAIRKLAKAGWVATGKAGKEKTVTITPEGEQLCERYREIREALLVGNVSKLGIDPAAMSALAGELRALSGQYDQATRGAASL
jgi:predicted MarR family transcription regulator